MPDGHRCPHCDALLDTPEALTAGECGCRHRGGHKHGDVILNPTTGRLLEAHYDRYSKTLDWIELAPLGYTHDNPPAGSVLVMRWVDGKRLPVVPLTDGEMFAVRAVS